jgi:WD40 repeat protein
VTSRPQDNYWHTKEGATVLILNGHKLPAEVLAFSPDGTQLASLSCDATRMWNGITGEPQQWPADSQVPTGAPPYLARALAFAPDGLMIGVIESDRLTVRNAATGREITTIPLTSAANYRGVATVLAFSPDGEMLTGAFFDLKQRMQWWRTETWEELPARGTGNCEAPILRIAFAPDSQTLASVELTRVGVWDVPTRTLRWSTPKPKNNASTLAFSHDGNWLAFSGSNRLFVKERNAFQDVAQVKLARKYFLDATFSPDDSYLAAVSKDAVVHMWDTSSWRERTSYAWEIGPLKSIAWSPDGMRMAAGSERGKIVLWDVGM